MIILVAENRELKWITAVVIYGVRQGSVLGQLLFNIYINDLFFSEEFQMTNFADDCSPRDFRSVIYVIFLCVLCIFLCVWCIVI